MTSTSSGLLQTLDNCSVGNALNDPCHHTVRVRTVALINMVEFSPNDLNLLKWRAGIDVSSEDNICFHHEKVFLTRYENLQRYCIDPYKRHKRQVTKSLRCVDENTAKLLDAKPGQKLCPRCDDMCRHKDNYLEETSHEEDYEPKNVTREDLTELDLLGCSPIKSVGKRDRMGYYKRKVSDVSTAVKSKLSKALDIDGSEMTQPERDTCVECKDLERLINLMKEKCRVSTRQEKIKILTLVPESWSMKKTVDTFGVTEHLVRKSRTLKKTSGILAESEARKGKKLATDVIEKVVQFYQSDDYSRMCPGKKDCVSTIVDGKKTLMQKRLLLVNLKELHTEFVKNTGAKIGFSKFCEHRPKWCIPVTSRGMHSVCVCQYHQNAKLLLNVIPEKHELSDLMLKIVCNVTDRTCMLHLCENCPGKSFLKEYLTNLFSQHDMDLEDTVIFKQWGHTDRTELASLQLPLSEFIEKVCDVFDALRQHHYITKAQSAYLKTLKDKLTSDTAIILMDFAENYSFLVQDAVQGYYWDNSQATLHPIVVYILVNGTMKCLSFCVISDCLKHDTTAANAFLTTVIDYINESQLGVTKIVYFSDGAASQYKNYKNLANLCHHDKDHGLQAQWHFFATSHGKSPCDGIGGTVKRLVARASLQACMDNHILTAEQMFQWATQNIGGIKFFYVDTTAIQIHADKYQLELRYSLANKIAGIRSHHSFVPTSDGKLEMRRVSEDDCCTIMCIGQQAVVSQLPDLDIYQPGKYIACIYDKDWFIGNIIERSDEHNDILVNFMRRTGTMLRWPVTDDNCWVPLQHVICTIKVPEVKGHGARQYILAQDDFEKIQALLPSF